MNTKEYIRAAFALVDRERVAVRAVEEEFELDKMTDHYGYVPLENLDNAYQCLFKNWNSLEIFTGQQKVRQIEHFHKWYQVDTILGCETQCDWRHSNWDQQFGVLFGIGESKQVCVDYNTTKQRENVMQDQWGGTAISIIGGMAVHVTDKEPDYTGLGRWPSQLIVKGDVKT